MSDIETAVDDIGTAIDDLSKTVADMDQKLSELLNVDATQLEVVELKLDTLINLYSRLLPDEPESTRHEIDELLCYVSGSGNTTWKAFTSEGDIIYLRQAHKAMLTEVGLWDELNEMNINETARCHIVLFTAPDGDFLKPVSIEPGWSIRRHEPVVPEKVKTNSLDRLTDIVASTDYVILDTETTDLNGYVVSVAILDPDGNTLLNRLVKPPVKINPEAARIHGITDDMVANAVPWTDPSVIGEISDLLDGTTVLGWNIDFDRGALIRTAQHSSDQDGGRAVRLLKSVTWVDVMYPYSEHIAREWSDYHGNYKWQKLTAAAAHYGIDTNGAHDALADAQMTARVLKRMIEHIIPF